MLLENYGDEKGAKYTPIILGRENSNCNVQIDSWYAYVVVGVRNSLWVDKDGIRSCQPYVTTYHPFLKHDIEELKRYVSHIHT